MEMSLIYINMNESKCLIDGKVFKNGGVMARHLKKEYGLTYREYYHNYVIKTDKIPTCKCGCGQEMNWKHSEYTEYAKGHYVKVPGQNSWGNNPIAVQKSAETRRRQYKNGERKIWCEGLTKETDIRIKRLGRKGSNTIMSNDDERIRRSTKMKNQWVDKNLTPLYGHAHPQWKGGASTIQQIARGNKRMYEEWKFPILERDDFKCTNCGSSDKLHVHHDDIEFCDIIQIIMLENKGLVESDDYDDKKLLADKVIDYHREKDVSGTTLCYKCHNELHPSLNFG
jgi:5-methylcytosine-specific restriction endonuclease McrA